MIGRYLGGVGGQVELMAVPQEASQMPFVVLDGLGGLALAAAVEDVALDEGLNTGDHKNMIQVVVAYLFHAVSARISLKIGVAGFEPATT